MVYCQKCGFQNPDDAENCSKCGASLYAVRDEGRRHKRREDECFGLPYGGAIAGLIFGLLIIIWGLSQVPGLLPANFEFWPVIVIIFGLLIVAGALYGLARRR